MQDKALTGHRILIVEDEEPIAEYLREILQESGAEVVGRIRTSTTGWLRRSKMASNWLCSTWICADNRFSRSPMSSSVKVPRNPARSKRGAAVDSRIV